MSIFFMIDKKVISKSIDDAIVKCGPTISMRISAFNPKDFKSEKYSRKDGQIKTAKRSPVGKLQQLQEDLQDEIDYTNEEKSMLSQYSIDFFPFTAYFYKDAFPEYFRKMNCFKWEWGGKNGNERIYKQPLELIDFGLDDFTGYDAQKGEYPDGSYMTYDGSIGTIPFMKGIEILDNMIARSPPLQENTLLYRIGVFDKNLKPGDTSKFKSYTSTSFNSYVAKSGLRKYAGFEPDEECYQLKIYAPKGTHGVVPCQNTGCKDWQSEFTLGRNQKYIVISVDHFKKTAEILLY